MNPEYLPVPQPDDISVREKEDAMGAYLMMFAALGAGLPLPIINLIASIIYFYVNKSKSRFVLFHSFQALLSQIPLTICNAIALFWGLKIAFSESWYFTDNFKGYLIMLIIANIIYFIFGIIAAIKARKGRMYYYWIFGKIAYAHAFSAGNSPGEIQAVNLPPRM